MQRMNCNSSYCAFLPVFSQVGARQKGGKTGTSMSDVTRGSYLAEAIQSINKIIIISRTQIDMMAFHIPFSEEGGIYAQIIPSSLHILLIRPPLFHFFCHCSNFNNPPHYNTDSRLFQQLQMLCSSYVRLCSHQISEARRLEANTMCTIFNLVWNSLEPKSVRLEKFTNSNRDLNTYLERGT